MGCTCLSLGISSCTTAPITERRQLKLLPESKLNIQAAQIYEKVKKKEKLIKSGKEIESIKKIGKKMEFAIGEYFYKTKHSDIMSLVEHLLICLSTYVPKLEFWILNIT